MTAPDNNDEPVTKKRKLTSEANSTIRQTINLGLPKKTCSFVQKGFMALVESKSI